MKKLMSSQPVPFLCSLLLLHLLAACGDDLPTYEGKSQAAAVSADSKQEVKPAGTAQKATEPKASETAGTTGGAAKTPADVAPSPATPPASTPPPASVSPIRTVANATEKNAMAALYALPSNQGGCVGCHGAIEVSEKKGRTAAQIQAAATINAHRTPAAANKWPKDLADTTNDGVDTAQLQASALADLLK